jgi:hypothetical protein
MVGEWDVSGPSSLDIAQLRYSKEEKKLVRGGEAKVLHSQRRYLSLSCAISKSGCWLQARVFGLFGAQKNEQAHVQSKYFFLIRSLKEARGAI